MALLLVLVCVALSSAVIAAATASSGRFAAQGEMDARYYAVTSAAGLFRDSLGADETATYVFTQRYTPGAGGAGGIVELVYPTGVAGAGDVGASGFEFLPEVTYYALYGKVPDAPADAAGNPVVSDAASGLVEPFDSGDFTSGEKRFSYSVKPASGWSGNKPAEVAVDAVLKNDWTLELDFHNADAAESRTFHEHMVLAANVQHDDSSSGSGARKRTTTVSWALQRVAQGEGNG